MGLGSFRVRLTVSLFMIFVVWQSVRFWAPTWQSRKHLGEYSHRLMTNDESHMEKDNQPQKITIGVYYEALCPDSRSFVLKQLDPTFRNLNERVILEMVPYGKATTAKSGDSYEFTCQHGPVECEANTIHACAIDVIADQTLQLQFLSCMITNNFDPENITKLCGERLKVDTEPILSCYRGTKGKELLAEYGRMTDALGSEIGFIPTITLDGSADNQRGILKNLQKEVCRRFNRPPTVCAA